MPDFKILQKYIKKIPSSETGFTIKKVNTSIGVMLRFYDIIFTCKED